jgi:hypothetical protein
VSADVAGLGAHVSNRDVRAAQAVVDALDELLGGFQAPAGWRAGRWTESQAQRVRVLLAGWAADLREAGHVEGVQVGRLQAAHVVLDALAGEGLTQTPSTPQAGW